MNMFAPIRSTAIELPSTCLTSGTGVVGLAETAPKEEARSKRLAVRVIFHPMGWARE